MRFRTRNRIRKTAIHKFSLGIKSAERTLDLTSANLETVQLHPSEPSMTSNLQAAEQPKSTNQISEFMKQVEAIYLLEYAKTIGVERRNSKRMPITMPVCVTELDEHFQPTDYQHHAVTRDISTTGVGLVTTNPIGRKVVELTFQPYQGQSFSTIAETIYCNEHGYYFQVGFQFVAEKV